jgi:hypothetical protein
MRGQCTSTRKRGVLDRRVLDRESKSILLIGDSQILILPCPYQRIRSTAGKTICLLKCTRIFPWGVFRVTVLTRSGLLKATGTHVRACVQCVRATCCVVYGRYSHIMCNCRWKGQWGYPVNQIGSLGMACAHVRSCAYVRAMITCNVLCCLQAVSHIQCVGIRTCLGAVSLDTCMEVVTP